MSAKGHEAEAATHEAEAADHQGAGEAARAVDRSPCPPDTRQPTLVAPCWSSTAGPGPEDLAQAEDHRRIAAEHRAASRALREAEARACAGILDADRDLSPFAHVEDIASIQPLIERRRMAGVVVTFRAVRVSPPNGCSES